ncbi:MAG TPA: NADH-quinone oxidoreductase subunit N [bacterium]|nr:NADH-quinone oxidoreductase subunit N [bacterium]
MTLNLFLLFPEWIIFGLLVILLIGEMTVSKLSPSAASYSKLTPVTAQIGSALVFLSVLPFAGRIDDALGGMFLLDPVATFFKAFFALTIFVVIATSREFFAASAERSGEFFLTLWSSLLGFFFLVSANDLLLLFIAIEIITLSFYIMTAYRKHSLASVEAGIKYLILGSLASAFLIYGVSLIYLGIGSTSLPQIRDGFAAQPQNPLLLSGILMVFAGVAFKIAVFPFQFWVPDVYEGAPTPAVAFLSVGSKAAGFAVLLRLLFTVFTPLASMGGMLLAVLAAFTLIYGNLGAILQTNIKRLMGYSSIGHAGYLLIGIAAGKEIGTSAVLYYLQAYAVTTLAIFLILTIAGVKLQSDQIAAYRGLSKRSPFLAGALFLAFLSSAGVPPLAGFMGKFMVLLAAVKENLAWLALLGALGVAVSLYYYLSVVKVMYIDEPHHEEPLALSFSSKCLLAALCVGILLVGIWQAPFLYFAQNAARYLF